MRRLLTRTADRPLAVVLPLQVLILFWRLDLLSPWFDEADTLLFMHGPLLGAIEIPAAGLHPPLYFALLWCWMRLPLGLAWTVQARTLSVLFTLAGTVAVDRLWTRQLARAERLWFLALWCLSPFLLLYGRMSRSYSLQLLLGAAGAALILRFAADRSRRNFWVVYALLVIAIYTHYVPGIALLAAANVVLARRRRWLDLAALDGLTAFALAPWLAWMIPQLEVWGAHHVAYALTGGAGTEIALKLAYWAMSFTMGEAIPDSVLIPGTVLVPAVLALTLAGAGKSRDAAWLGVPAVIVGFLGVTRWVAYPFIPARMIFCFPIFMAFFIGGAARYRVAGRVALCAMLAVSLSGIWCYFHLIGFRNKQYPLPMREIASRILSGLRDGRTTVLVDSSNSDIIGLRYALGGAIPALATGDRHAPEVVQGWFSDPGIRTIWFLRNTHDVSPEGLNARWAARLAMAMHESRFFYEPFTPLELRLMRALGMRDPPRYFHELDEFRR